MSLVVLNPTETLPTAGLLSPRLDTLEGKTLGVIWNGRRPGPGDRVLLGVAEELKRRHRMADVIFRVKPYLGNMAPGDVLGEMAARSHAVITGIGD